jgi:site-specific DNA-methyltransferase (adenine-specific)
MTSIVYNRDCMAAMREFPDKYFDLAVVDPPYGIGYSELVGKKKKSDGWKERNASQWDNAIPNIEYFIELFRVSKNQIIWGGNYFELPPSRCFLIWDKVQRIDQADCELAWCSFSSSARVFRYARGNESGFAPKLKGAERSGINIHPTQKPIALYDWIYKNYLPDGGRVIDTHLGSGSNRIAADRAGNIDFYGYELDPDYYAAQEKRYAEYKSQLKLF